MPTQFIKDKVSEVIQTAGNVTNDVAGNISANLYLGSQKVDPLELARNLIEKGAHIVDNIPNVDDIKNSLTQILRQECIKQAEAMVDTVKEIIAIYKDQIEKIAEFWLEIADVIYEIVSMAMRGEGTNHKAMKLANFIASSIELELREIGNEINERLSIGGMTFGVKTGLSGSLIVGGASGNVGFMMGGNAAALQFGVFGDVGVSCGPGARADGKVDLCFSTLMPSGMPGPGLTCFVAGGIFSGFQIGIDFALNIKTMSASPTGVTIGKLAGLTVVTGIGLDFTQQFCLVEFKPRKNNYKRAAEEKISRWSNWATKNQDPNGKEKSAISLEGKNCIVVQEQPGYGIVDIGFGVDNINWVTSIGNTNGKSIVKRFYGKILRATIKEQFGYGIIDINFSYTEDGSVVSETGWFCDNMDHDRKVVVEQVDGADAAQVLDQSGYGVIDFRLGCQNQFGFN